MSITGNRIMPILHTWRPVRLRSPMRSSVMTDTMQSRAEQLKSLALAAPYVDLYPDDVNEALSYGYMAYRLDTIPEAVRVLERTYARNPKATGALLILRK